MIVITCIDDNGGTIFNHRRQSQDRILRAKIVELVGSTRLWMNQYSAAQFEDCNLPNCTVDEDFLQRANPGEYCFVEGTPLMPVSEKLEKVILFRWNRTYPSDQKLDLVLTEDGWVQEVVADFEGYSHEKITMEVYVR